MRQVLSISLPAPEVKQFKRRAKTRGYSSMSSYVHELLKADAHLISEKELLKTIREGQKEYENGTCLEIKSLADLL